ncbi:MAG: bifunctional indole-3-glycerol phosphate synthase/phosphoribosylanthranilate isomerase [Treponema sp.]|nr:bifunctional indole-3-glycerol phosphate synthase/phosphoribosylanthranilate isomerase [Treponema sp.]
MSASILDEIVERRRADIAKKGFDFGFDLPEKRTRGNPVPFVAEKGAILEIKRASPSKGDIAPDLSASKTALAYCEAGAAAISVLTEENYFHGSLLDLIEAGKSVDEFAEKNPGAPKTALLRKDFLLCPEEIDVAYRCGADAVLLIARILSADDLSRMIKKCESLEMTAFVELRLKEDLDKLASVVKSSDGSGVDKRFLVCGVNARDLSNFRIDLLTPCAMLSEIRGVLGKDARVVFESGIRTPLAAGFAGSLGFTGMLLGEAAAKNPKVAGNLVSSFKNGKECDNSRFWNNYARLLHNKKSLGNAGCGHSKMSLEKRPFVKICGLTVFEDAVSAAMNGADFLGFIFSAKSPRKASEEVVRKVRRVLDEQYVNPADQSLPPDCVDEKPMLVGVVTDLSSDEGKLALSLCREKVLDVIQLHGKKAVSDFYTDSKNLEIAHYAVVNVSCEDDLADLGELRKMGEPRVLVDAKSAAALGGTGSRVDSDLVNLVSSKIPLWLAGGITPENVADLIGDCAPEMIDVASGVESEPGVKDCDKLLKLDEEINRACMVS